MLKHMSKKARDYALSQDWNTVFNKLIMEYEEIIPPTSISPILFTKKA